MSGPVVLRKREPITFGSELLLFTLKFVFFGRNRVLRQVLVLSIILEVEHTDWFPQVNLLSVPAYGFLHNQVLEGRQRHEVLEQIQHQV